MVSANACIREKERNFPTSSWERLVAPLTYLSSFNLSRRLFSLRKKNPVMAAMIAPRTAQPRFTAFPKTVVKYNNCNSIRMLVWNKNER